jgi:phenylacetate-CoA ligase
MTFMEKLKFAYFGRSMAAELSKMPFKERIALKEIQNARFMKIFQHACRTVPFYKRKYRECGVLTNRIRSIEDIKELPVVEKGELSKLGFDDLTSDQFRDRSKLFMFVTGGTSGEALKVYHSLESVFLSFASYHRAYADMMGGRYNRSDVAAYVYTSEYPFRSFFGAYRQAFIWTLDPPEVIRSKLINVQPQIITSYPSVLERVTSHLTTSDVKKIAARLRGICLNSEMSTQIQRDRLEALWGVPVRDEFCSEEISTIMFHQCSHKRYHVNQDLCFIESVNDHGGQNHPQEEGDLVVTGFSNFAMPLIRYNQQDRVVLDSPEERCSCGSQFPMVKSFLGRTNDAFLLPSGRRLTSGYLLDVGYSILVKHADYILYWTLIQEAKDKIVLECNFTSLAPRNLAQRIEADLKPLFYGEVNVEVRINVTPRRSAKGKHKQVVSLLESSSDELSSCGFRDATGVG